MLELRPVCENCKKALPPHSAEAMICSFECTFCSSCVQDLLHNVCPNCGGGFVPRPVRPKEKLIKNPPTGNEIFKPVDVGQFSDLLEKYRKVPPGER
jgi:uncharacterized protein